MAPGLREAGLLAPIGALSFGIEPAPETDVPTTPAGELAASQPPRYLIQRTFPAGAIDAIDAATKKRVNDNNRALGVTWVHSYLNADKTRSVCVYTAPNEAAVREAAKLNDLPIDSIVEMPFILYPE